MKKKLIELINWTSSLPCEFEDNFPEYIVTPIMGIFIVVWFILTFILFIPISLLGLVSYLFKKSE